MSTYAKIQIWKRFTTPLIDSSFENSCVYLCKDTNLKAIHNYQKYIWSLELVVSTYAKIQIWKRFTTQAWWVVYSNSCVYLCKDTNLKAIHNSWNDGKGYDFVVSTYAKIQIWKRFTTWRVLFPYANELCLPMQRYKFESDSQRVNFVPWHHAGCVYLCKDTNLKAIHNCLVIVI